MLESTNMSYQEVMDNTDTYGDYLFETDMSEYAQAFKNTNAKQ